MLSLALFHFLEVGVNPIQDFRSFALAIFDGQPFQSIAVMLFIVAAISAMAKRYDVVKRISAAFRDWNPVILRKGMPQTRRATAYGATTAKMVKRELPVAGSESGGKLAHAGATTLALNRVFVGMLNSPALASFRCLFCVTLCIALLSRAGFGRVKPAPFLFPCILFGAILKVPLLQFLARAIGVGNCPLPCVSNAAYLAQGIDTPAPPNVEKLPGGRKFAVASSTADKRVGDIQHSDLTLAGSHAVCGQNGVSAVLVGLQSLDHTSYYIAISLTPLSLQEYY